MPQPWTIGRAPWQPTAAALADIRWRVRLMTTQNSKLSYDEALYTVAFAQYQQDWWEQVGRPRREKQRLRACEKRIQNRERK